MILNSDKRSETRAGCHVVIWLPSHPVKTSRFLLLEQHKLRMMIWLQAMISKCSRYSNDCHWIGTFLDLSQFPPTHWKQIKNFSNSIQELIPWLSGAKTSKIVDKSNSFSLFWIWLLFSMIDSSTVEYRFVFLHRLCRIHQLNVFQLLRSRFCPKGKWIWFYDFLVCPSLSNSAFHRCEPILEAKQKHLQVPMRLQTWKELHWQQPRSQLDSKRR